jgi:hypothetical protein
VKRNEGAVRDCGGPFGVVQAVGLPYLESYGQGGGVDDWKVEWNRSGACRRTVMRLWDQVDGLEKYHPVHCYKPWCPTCGGFKGKIHNKRFSRALDYIGDADNVMLRQFVFTVPPEIRSFFEDTKGCNALFNMAKRVIKKYFDGKSSLAYLHYHGDKDVNELHPHINVHVIEPKYSIGLLSADRLDAIKETWLKALRHYTGQKGMTIADLYYSFRQGKGKVIHAIRYMSKPMMTIKRDGNWIVPDEFELGEEMAKKIVAMKGFKFLRMWGPKREIEIEDCDEIDSSRYVFLGTVTMEELQDDAIKRRCRIKEGSDGFLEFEKIV